MAESTPTSGTETSPLPRSFMIIAVMALVLNLLGVSAYIMQVTMDAATLTALPDAERLLYETTPAWATGAFAIAVHAGALGCILLLFKKAWAMPVFIVSLLGVLVQMVHSFFFSNSFEVFGPGGAIMPIMVVCVSVYLVWYSKQAKDKAWIA